MDKKYLLRIISYVALALAALVLIADIAIQIGASMVQEVETASTELIETSENIIGEGYIVRTESVLSLQTGGYLGYTVSDGERVSEGGAVAGVYTDTADHRTLLKEIQSINHRLELLGRANSVKGIYTTVSADQRIAALRLQLNEASAGGGFGSKELEDELLVMLYVRDMKTGKSTDEMKAALRQSLSEKEAQLGSPEKRVFSDKLGYFYSECDGYESFMDGERVMNASISDFSDLLHRKQQPISDETAVGKVVTDYNWYLVCEFPTDEVQGMTQSQNYNVRFADGRTLSMKLARLVYEYGSETSVLVFQSSDMPEGFEYTRFQTVTIAQEVFNGYRVPVSAVRSLNGISGVYVLRGSIVEFREISPVSVQDGMVVVDADAEATGSYKMLQYYDRIIVRGKELSVRKIID